MEPHNSQGFFRYGFLILRELTLIVPRSPLELTPPDLQPPLTDPPEGDPPKRVAVVEVLPTVPGSYPVEGSGEITVSKNHVLRFWNGGLTDGMHLDHDRAL